MSAQREQALLECGNLLPLSHAATSRGDKSSLTKALTSQRTPQLVIADHFRRCEPSALLLNISSRDTRHYRQQFR